jgi:hypothetical protein
MGATNYALFDFCPRHSRRWQVRYGTEYHEGQCETAGADELPYGDASYHACRLASYHDCKFSGKCIQNSMSPIFAESGWLTREAAAR